MLDSNDIVSTTCFTVLRMAKEKNGGDCMLLYMRYMTQKRIQETANTHSNDSFMMKAMGWGKERFGKAKAFLLENNLIEPLVRKNENGTIEGHYIRVKCDIGLPDVSQPLPSFPTDRLNPPSGEQETNTIVENINTIEENINIFPSENINLFPTEKTIKKKTTASQIQTDILSEEIYCSYISNFPSDKKKWAKKGQSLLYISSLLKTYDSIFLLSCVATYKKTVEAKWWKAPQYFFCNSKSPNAKEYMFFLDYAPTDNVKEQTEEDMEEKKRKALAFFGGS